MQQESDSDNLALLLIAALRGLLSSEHNNHSLLTF